VTAIPPYIDHASLPVIEGRRCTLKPLELEHVTPEYVSWLADPEVNQFLESRFVEHDLDSVKAFVASVQNSGTTWFYGIWAKSSKSLKHVGNIKLGPVDRNHLTADIGFLIGNKGYWGKGIGSEAIALMLEFGFANGLKKITAGAYENNPGSSKALLKGGFVEEGLRRSQVSFGDERISIRLFGATCS
jgi:RimJ/RimL family protein N-acetyltransferase